MISSKDRGPPPLSARAIVVRIVLGTVAAVVLLRIYGAATNQLGAIKTAGRSAAGHGVLRSRIGGAGSRRALGLARPNVRTAQ